MKAKCLAIQSVRSKTGKTFYIANMKGVGKITVWQRLYTGKTYEFDIVEKGGYKNAKNVFECFDEDVENWGKEKESLIKDFETKNGRLKNEITLLKEHISLLENIIDKITNKSEAN